MLNIIIQYEWRNRLSHNEQKRKEKDKHWRLTHCIERIVRQHMIGRALIICIYNITTLILISYHVCVYKL